MTGLDWTVIVVYLVSLIGLGAYLNRHQETTRDYFLAGQSMSWWQTGFSTMATQLSAISFISAPAFVALADNGGLRWLAYEFAVPLALVVVMVVIIPVLHRGGYISIHKYLEDRFDGGTRALASGLFLLMRGLSSGVIVFAGAKVLSAAIDLSLTESILLIGLITIVYDVLGGIGVVIVSDVVQMGLIFLGLIYCGLTAVDVVGWQTAWQAFEPERTNILFMNNYGVNEDNLYGFWPFLVGGFVLYVSYYGCDQSQVQREMSVEDEDAVRKSMLLNAFGRFPLVLVYCVVGILVGAVIFKAPETVSSGLEMNASQLTETLNEQPDYMLPYFIVGGLPSGVTGLLIVAIMAALMSSLDSAINSLSAITVRDFYREFVTTEGSSNHYLRSGRFFTFFWGTFATVSALLFHYRQGVKTVIEQINQIGNMFYGPLAAAFLLGILTDWARPNGIKFGMIAGLLADVFVWLYAPFISWLWWGPIGFLVTVLVVLVHAPLTESDVFSGGYFAGVPEEPSRTNWGPWYVACGLYFLVIIGICYALEVSL